MDYATSQVTNSIPAAPVQLETQRFTFTGSGSEYFRIWIVNLLLTILTLGIYSAWAKVRKQKYLYNNTHVAGSSFEYHGKPIAILKGRLISMAILGIYYGVATISPILGLAALVALMAVIPWLLWKSFQFKLYNSSYRGVRFGFDGTIGGSYFVFLVLPIGLFIALFALIMFAGAIVPKNSVIGIVVTGLVIAGFSMCIYPYMHYRLKQYQHNNSRFGTTSFVFEGQFADFFKAYFFTGLIFLGCVIILGLIFGTSLLTGMRGAENGKPPSVMLFVTVLAFYGLLFAIAPVLTALIQNAVWSKTRLSEHQFTSNLPIGKTVFVSLTNVLLVVCTLGLGIPFAAMRMAKLKTEALALEPADDLNAFMAGAQNEASATGEGMADFMDFDIAL
jgi:uncharacterized membrane protein YjgN (DUF898 family)